MERTTAITKFWRHAVNWLRLERELESGKTTTGIRRYIVNEPYRKKWTTDQADISREIEHQIEAAGECLLWLEDLPSDVDRFAKAMNVRDVETCRRLWSEIVELEEIPKQYQTDAYPKKNAAAKHRPDLSANRAMDALNEAMNSGEIRYIKKSEQRFIFDKRQIDLK